MTTVLDRPTAQTLCCNLCGRDIAKDATGYYEDHVSLIKNWGYHSPFDGEVHALVLCVDCYRGLVSQFEIKPKVDFCNYTWGENNSVII